jgi:uncharacterized protein (TIGR02145 family)
MNKIEQIKELKLLFESGVLNQEQYTKLLNEIVEKSENNSNLRFEGNTVQKDTQIKSEEKTEDYKSVIIGNQEWMSQNLNVKTFRNGDLIYEATNDSDWIKAFKSQTPAWCYYDGDPIHAESGGLLYNFYAVHDPRGLSPSGWQIPNIKDYEILLENTTQRDLRSREGWHNIETDEVTGDFDDDDDYDLLVDRRNIGGQLEYYKLIIKSGENGTNKNGFNLKPSGFYFISNRKMNFDGGYFGGTEDFIGISTDTFLWIRDSGRKFASGELLNSGDSNRITGIRSEFRLLENKIFSKEILNDMSGYNVRCIKNLGNNYHYKTNYKPRVSNPDSLLKEAAQIIVDSQQGSRSLLQRKLIIGYHRAEKLINQLTEAGILSPLVEGKITRDVLVDNLNDFEGVLD